MTAELWLQKPCPTHRDDEGCLMTRPEARCVGASRVRLDPDRVVFKPWAVDAMADAEEQITVQNIIDALTEQETE